MMRLQKNFLCLFLLFFSVFSYASNDRVTQLPGLSVVSNKQYAGYAQLDHHKKLFYWFVSSDQKNAPIILWSNGGPGYSSLYGFFNETGPYEITASLQLKSRKHGWNHFANYLVIDQPENVGLSDLKNNPCAKTRAQAIDDYYQALHWFLSRHPRYQHRAIFLAGESYAGTYLPLLANKILEENKTKKNKIHLKGLILISPWADPRVQQSMDSAYAMSHGFISENQKYELDALYARCAALIDAKKDVEANKICGSIGDRIQAISHLPDLANIAYTKLDDNALLDQYVNQKAFLNAVHANDAKKFKCFSNRVNAFFMGDIQRSIKMMYDKLLTNHLPVLIFSGLNDMKDTNFLGENAFIHTLEWPQEQLFLNQVARPVILKTRRSELILGYEQSGGGLTWVKVLNAGHMVPKDQPRIDAVVKEFVGSH